MKTRILPSVSDDFKFSRKLFIAECLFEYFISILVTGAFLAKLTTTIGISDSMTAILSELTAFSGIFQLISIYLAHKTPVKRWLVPLMVLTQLLFASVYLIPILDIKLSASVLFFIAIFLARALASVCSPIKHNMMMSLVEPSKRGQFTSINNITSLIGAMFFTFGASYLLDYFEESGNMDAAYLTFSIIILVLIVLHTLSLSFAKENAPPTVFKNASPFSSVKELLCNKEYKSLLIAYTIFSVASAITTPFLGTYQINELGFSMTLISIMDIAIMIILVVVLYFFGRYSMHTSYTSLIRMSHFFYVFAFLAIVFTTPANGIILFISYRIILVVGNAARTVSATNLLYSLAPPEDRTSALAINTIITGVISFFSTLAVTPFVDYVQTNGNTFFGHTIYAQQILALVSVVLIILLIIYFRFGCKNRLEKAEKTMH